MRKAAIILFETPDGIVLNLKDNKHRYPNSVAAFGGEIEDGETADEAVKREIREETSLNPDSFELKAFKIYQFDDKIFHLYTAELPDSNFKVFEGAGIYTLKPGDDLDAINFPVKTRQIITDYIKAKE